MSKSLHSCLLNDCFVTYGAILSFRLSCLGAGGSYFCQRFLILVRALSVSDKSANVTACIILIVKSMILERSLRLLNDYLVTSGTMLTFRKTLLYASGFYRRVSYLLMTDGSDICHSLKYLSANGTHLTFRLSCLGAARLYLGDLLLCVTCRRYHLSRHYYLITDRATDSTDRSRLGAGGGNTGYRGQNVSRGTA